MRNLSSTFRREMFYGNRNYNYKAVVTLADETTFTLTNTKLWSNGFTFDDAVSEDNEFTALGSAIIGSASIVIDNMDDTYSEYDFTNAKVSLSLSMTYTFNERETIEEIALGEYTVDDTEYNGALITLNLLDNMEQFDRPYSSSTLIYPASLLDIIRNACTDCGVMLQTYDFPHKNYLIPTKPDDEDITYRDVIEWVATIAGCFARCNSAGKLELKWFDVDTLDEIIEGLDTIDGGKFDNVTPYSTGDSLDGGSFNPWSSEDDWDDGEFTDMRHVHYISNLYTQTIGIDDIVITGIGIVLEESDASGNLVDKEYIFGRNGYTIRIEGNPLITTTNCTEIGVWLMHQIVGLRFRNVNVTHLNDPSIEAGDIGVVVDRKENRYPILITRTNFTAGTTQTTVCGAESASRNSATRYSEATRAYVEARRLLNRERSARDLALQDLTNRLNAKSGLYTTTEVTASGNIYYLHDKPLLEDSAVVWKMTTEAWGVTTDYQGDDTVWNGGMTVDGDVIARILSATGVNANWINTGAIQVGTGENERFYANIATNTVRLSGDIKVGGTADKYGTISVYTASNDVGAEFSANGLYIYDEYSTMNHYQSYIDCSLTDPTNPDASVSGLDYINFNTVPSMPGIITIASLKEPTGAINAESQINITAETINLRSGRTGSFMSCVQETSGDYTTNKITALCSTFNFSDKRAKEHIQDSTIDYEHVVKNLRVVSFDWKDRHEPHVSAGLIAQEVMKIMPELTTQTKEGMYFINYIGIIPILVGESQRQQKVIEEMTQTLQKNTEELATQQKKIEDLEMRLAKLEALLN